MSSRVWISPQARVQTLQARRWWRENRPAAPHLFGSEFTAALLLLAGAPDIGQAYDLGPVLGVRRLPLRQTRYHIYYVHDAAESAVLLLAVWSAVRGRAPRLRVV